jgi:hypothetical protein
MSQVRLPALISLGLLDEVGQLVGELPGAPQRM